MLVESQGQTHVHFPHQFFLFFDFLFLDVGEKAFVFLFFLLVGGEDGLVEHFSGLFLELFGFGDVFVVVKCFIYLLSFAVEIQQRIRVGSHEFQFLLLLLDLSRLLALILKKIPQIIRHVNQKLFAIIIIQRQLHKLIRRLFWLLNRIQIDQLLGQRFRDFSVNFSENFDDFVCFVFWFRF